MHLKYIIAKIVGKLLRKNLIIRYLKLEGVNIEGKIYCYSDIVTTEAYLITIKMVLQYLMMYNLSRMIIQ